MRDETYMVNIYVYTHKQYMYYIMFIIHNIMYYIMYNKHYA